MDVSLIILIHVSTTGSELEHCEGARPCMQAQMCEGKEFFLFLLDMSHHSYPFTFTRGPRLLGREVDNVVFLWGCNRRGAN